MVYTGHVEDSVNHFVVPSLLDTFYGLPLTAVDSAVCEGIEYPISDLTHGAEESVQCRVSSIGCRSETWELSVQNGVPSCSCYWNWIVKGLVCLILNSTIRGSTRVAIGCSEDKKVNEGPTGVFEIQGAHGDGQDFKSLFHVSRRLRQNIGHEGRRNEHSISGAVGLGGVPRRGRSIACRYQLNIQVGFK